MLTKIHTLSILKSLKTSIIYITGYLLLFVVNTNLKIKPNIIGRIMEQNASKR